MANRRRPQRRWPDGWVALASVSLVACSPAPSVVDGGPDDGGVADAGAAWRVVQSELPGALLSAWESRDGVLYAVGGTATTALVLRHDADGWWQMDPGTSSVLWWVHGLSAGDVWAVGANGVVTHFDGVRWVVERESGPATLYGLTGASRDGLVAVGGVTSLSAPRAELLRRTSAGWEEVPAPASASGWPLFKVWSRAPDALVLVGERGFIASGPIAALTVESSGVTDRLTTVHGNGADVYAVGGLQRPVLLRRAGPAWRSLEVPGTPQLLNGVAVAPDGELVVAGLSGYLASGSGDGLQLVRPVTERDLHAVLPVRGGFVAVGGDLVQRLGRGVVLARAPLEGGALRSWPFAGIRFDAGAPDAGPGDGGVGDAGVPDAGGVDAGLPDAGLPDAGLTDAGVDAGASDAGRLDGGGADSGMPDGGAADASVSPDASTPDAGADAAVVDAGVDAGADAGLGAGADCQGRFADCTPPLDCTMILPSSPLSFRCVGACMDATACGAYGAGSCCRLPNPQTFSTVCLPADFCDAGS